MFAQAALELLPITQADLAGVMAVQARAYGHALLESPEVLGSKLGAPGKTCWGAFAAPAPGGGVTPKRLCAYAIAHVQAPGVPLGLNKALDRARAPAPGDWLYVHDIAVDPDHGGRQIAERLLARVLASARRQGLRRAMLVAVQGAEAYWARHGFAARPAPMPVCGFGADAVWMVREI